MSHERIARCIGRARGGTCEAAIVWAVNEKTGRRVPLDAEPAPDGRFLVTGPETCRSLTDAEVAAREPEAWAALGRG